MRKVGAVALLLGWLPLIFAAAPGCSSNGSSSSNTDGAASSQEGGGSADDASPGLLDAGDATHTPPGDDASGPADGSDASPPSSDATSDTGAGDGSAAMPRPSYNLGTGFFVVGSKLYDANGVEFRIRGVNKLHWDNGSPGLAGSHANTVRWVIDFTQPTPQNLALVRGGAGKTPGTIYNRMVVMPGAWYSPAGTVTCSSDPATVSSAVSVWVAQASTWTQIERYSIINIANEWGPSSSTVWRDSYISAISQLRAAGYHATLSITSGGCGQDNADLVTYAKAVFDSDPEKNVIFDRHVYGGDGDAGALDTDVHALAALGLPVILGEFGPGRNIGPSPTNLTPSQVIQTAEKYGLGWMSWAWDDNNLSNAQADNDSFALSYTGAYTKSSDLTIAGQEVVEGCTNPTPGGCGCPDSPQPALTAVAPGCTGVPAPTVSTYSLAHLAVAATIF
jgi:hypothetical protein